MFQYGIFKLWLECLVFLVVGVFCLLVFVGFLGVVCFWFCGFFQFVFRSSLDLGGCQYLYSRQ